MMEALINSFIEDRSVETFCDSVDSASSRQSDFTPDCEMSKLALATLDKDGKLVDKNNRFSTLKKVPVSV